MSINFINILDTDIETQMEVRNWRNDENIRKYMFNDHIISEKEHLDWLKSLENRDKSLFFIAYKDDNPIGVSHAIKIDDKNKTCYLGIYLNPDYFFLGLGSYVYYLLNMYSKTLGADIDNFKSYN